MPGLCQIGLFETKALTVPALESPRLESWGTGRVAKARSGLPIGFPEASTTGSPAEPGFRALFMCPGILSGGS